jgi:ADP-ribose pyrophosphatase
MAFFEKTLSTEEHFRGRIVTVRTDTVELTNGHISFREVVDHPGGVGIVAIDKNNNVLVVRQFRYPMSRELIEIPAGKLEKGEDPLECAIRELSEETGYSAGKMISLGAMYPSPGYCQETLYGYLALDLNEGESHPDEDEFLAVERIPFEKACEMALSGEICDGKTVVSLLRAKWHLENNK